MDFKKTYGSVMWEFLDNILIYFVILMKLEMLIKLFLTETYRRVLVGKNLSDLFPIRKDLKKTIGFIAIAFQLCFSVRI